MQHPNFKRDPIARADAYLEARKTQPPVEGEETTIKNQTEWHTGDIKRLCHRVCDEMKVSRRRTVKVVYARNCHWGSSGYAWYNTRSIVMRVPRPPGPKKFAAQGPFPVLDFARVFEHEVQHNLGLAHHSMSHCHGNRKPAVWFPWIGEYKVRGPKISEPKKVDRVAEGEKKAIAALERWESKLRRAQKGVKKAKAKVAYYQRTQAKRATAAAACAPQTESPTTT